MATMRKKEVVMDVADFKRNKGILIEEYQEGEPPTHEFHDRQRYLNVKNRVLSEIENATNDQTVDLTWLQAEFRELYGKFKENGDMAGQRKMLELGRQIVKNKTEMLKDMKEIEDVSTDKKVQILTTLIKKKVKEEKLLPEEIKE